KAVKISAWPECLTGFNKKEHKILSPFTIDCGPYSKKKHGYRVKTGGFRIIVKSAGVSQSISSLPDNPLKLRLQMAYEHLYTCAHSSYKKYVDHANTLESETRIQFFDLFHMHRELNVYCGLSFILITTCAKPL
uniref:Uncharacterized protein n=1 Tax=Ciona intestinalis TaxID=7719 RepID=H2XV10_CIOIN